MLITNTPNHVCPLCASAGVKIVCRDKRRDYFRCRTCDLVSVPSAQFLSPEDEKARYDLHQNSPDDWDYRRFLSHLFVPMLERLGVGSHGLDFGSGPNPTLSVMFEKVGHSMAIYDPFYANNAVALEELYDFVTATEVVEHLRDPARDLDRLWSCVKSGGSLGLMTKLAPDSKSFANWHYTNDLTHVCFFSRSTFKWLASQWQAELAFADEDVILFRKTEGGRSSLRGRTL